ncbi:MAG: DUF1367 family protein [Bacteroidales bacterium]
MKLQLLNTVQGLKPMYDSDYEEKKKLKIGEVYTCEIRLLRNYQFHKKYFALINCAWEYQNEKVIAHFSSSKEAFRKTVEIAAGWYEQVYSLERKEWLQTPKSIAFDKMDNIEFDHLYNNVKTVLFNIFLSKINKTEFLNNLLNF